MSQTLIAWRVLIVAMLALTAERLATAWTMNLLSVNVAQQIGGNTVMLDIFPHSISLGEIECADLTLKSRPGFVDSIAGLPTLPRTVRLKSLASLYAGDSRGAITFAQTWINQSPSDSFARFILATATAAQSKCVNLVAHFKSTPRAADLFFILGQSAQRDGRIPTAIAYHTAAVTITSNHLLSINALIYLYAMTRNHEGEIAALEKYLAHDSVDKTSRLYFMRLARLQELRSRWAEALQTYRQTCSAFPQFAECHYRAGEVYRGHFNDLPRAKQEFELAIQKDPQMILAWGSLNFVLVSQGKQDEVDQLLVRMRQAMPNSETPDLYAGWDALLLNKPEEAIPYLELTVKKNPQSGIGFELLGQAYELVGNVQGAVNAYRQAAVLNPYSAQVAARLGTTLLSAGQEDEACDSLKRALQLESTNTVAQETKKRLKNCP